MTVIARDSVASDHLVYAWPFPIGPECEVACGDDEQVVMCPSYMVGDRLGPGRHRWRTPDPMRPVSAFFVLTAPVEAPFDMVTQFIIPTTGMPVRLRACGSLQIRCGDPGLLIAQFVGLPFDHVNDGILRSVSRSVERMLARLLTRRVIMAGTPMAVTDPQMMASIIEELVAYNPTAGAVFGVELTRMGHMMIAADDGSSPYLAMPAQNLDWSGGVPRVRPMPPPIPPPNGNRAHRKTDVAPLVPAAAPPVPEAAPTPASSTPGLTGAAAAAAAQSGDIPLLETVRGVPPAPTTPPRRTPSTPPAEQPSVPPRTRAASQPSGEALAAASGEIQVKPPPGPISSPAVEVPRSPDEITHPNLATPPPGSVRLQTPVPSAPGAAPAILGIGMGAIGGASTTNSGTSSTASGEIQKKVEPGRRVLVPGPNGLMQSATVRQLLSGYYELEVGSSGETIWVPMSGVVPE